MLYMFVRGGSLKASKAGRHAGADDMCECASMHILERLLASPLVACASSGLATLNER